MSGLVHPLRAEGYRPFFVFFPVWGALVVGLWALSLQGLGPMRSVDHGAVMIWGVFGSAALGFLLTAYPRQNEAPPPGPRGLGLALGAQVLTQAALLASWFGAPWGPPARALATLTGGLLWAGLALWTLGIAVRRLRRAWDGTTFGVPIALAAGAVGWLAVGLGQAPLGFRLGAFGMFVPLALLLLDRLVPFFSGRVVEGYSGGRRRGFAALLLPLSLLRALAGPHWALDLALALLIAWQASGWRPDQSWRRPMVGVLHLGVAWIFLAFLLSAWSGAAAGTLPMHLALLGGLGTLLFGIATRVTLGHGGLPVAADRVTLLVLALAEGAVVLRVILPILGLGSPNLLLASAALFGLAFAVWALRFGPLALRRAAG